MNRQPRIAPLVEAKRRLLRRGAKGPSMRQQCRMGAVEAVSWQAALILEGRRGVLTLSQTKLDKAIHLVNRGLTMATAHEAEEFMWEGYNACHGLTEGCVKVCVGSNTGQGKLPGSFIARCGRTVAEACDYERYHGLLDVEVERERLRAAKRGKGLAIRPNVATDNGERAGAIAARHPGVDFYDYTAVASIMRRDDGVMRVYSRKEGPQRHALTMRMLEEGRGVAVVVDTTARSKGPLPDTWEGYPAIDGDIDDLWFARAPQEGPFVVLLRVKGDKQQVAHAIDTGFAAPTWR